MPSKQKLKDWPPLDAGGRERLGKDIHAVWQAVRKQQRAGGVSADVDDTVPWDKLEEKTKEVFRKSGEAVVVSKKTKQEYDRLMWEQVEIMRKEMGEKAFRKKMFEICISIAVQGLAPQLSELEREKATIAIVGLSGMLEVPGPTR